MTSFKQSLTDRGLLLKPSFAGGLLITMWGAWLKIVHEPGADTWLLIGMALSLVFIATALYEILTSRRIERSEKLLWTIGLVFLAGITGLLYLLSERKRIKPAH
jgi:lipid-A-disaccharide synthase-like uncharacterized protein